MYKLLLTLTVVVASLLMLSLASTVNSAEIEDCSKIDQDTWLCLSNNFSYTYRLNLAKDEMVLSHDSNLRVESDGVVTLKTKQFFTESDIAVSKDFGGVQRIKVLYDYSPFGQDARKNFLQYWTLASSKSKIDNNSIIFYSPATVSFKPNLPQDFVLTAKITSSNNKPLRFGVLVNKELLVTVASDKLTVDSPNIRKRGRVVVCNFPANKSCSVYLIKSGNGILLSVNGKLLSLDNVLNPRQWSAVSFKIPKGSNIKMEELVIHKGD